MECYGVEGLLTDHLRHSIGQLDFAARSFPLMLQDGHHLWLEDVTARNDEVGGRVLCRGLFNQTLHFGNVALCRAGFFRRAFPGWQQDTQPDRAP